VNRQAPDRPILFVGRAIHTMDPRTAGATTVAVTGERIAAVGGDELRGRFADAEVVELGDRPLLPGFVDAHNHLSLAALLPRFADLSDARSVAEIGTALGEQAAREPAAPWVRGSGWERRVSAPLGRHDLDALGFDRPILVEHFSLHQAVVCSRGLEELGIDHSTPDPAGGRIERDPDGRPTGLLVETAWGWAQDRALAGYTHPDRWGELIRQRIGELHRQGITAVHDAACSPEAEAVYRRLHATDQLDLSVLAMPHPRVFMGELDRSRLEGPPTGEGDEVLRVGAVKLFADGGAHPDMHGCIAGTRHRFGLPAPPVTEQARIAADAGFAVAIHAMGNGGMQRALDAIEVVRDGAGVDRVARVEHATLLSDEQVERLRHLEATAVVQPGFRDTLGRNVADLRFDDLHWMPFGRLAERAVALAASSDHPCSPSPPLTTSIVATDTPSSPSDLPGERLTYDAWLEAWTHGAASAGDQTHERGRLTPGLTADLVVLDRPLDPEDPPGVAQTWVRGQLVHHEGPAPRRANVS